MAGAVESPELVLWLSLSTLPGIGRHECLALVEHFGSAHALFAAPRRELRKLLPERPETVAAIVAGPHEASWASTLAWLARPRHHAMTWADADYPPLLRKIPDPPLVLYVLGERTALGLPQLAMVGSRNPSAAGRETAQAFARHLASAGLAITSGLALGIDGAAHQGALDAASGATIAVVATGLDRVYPAHHKELAHEIAARGALVSEFVLGTPPLPENFRVRNRLISGLSLGVLVVEAAVGCGSLIAARLATDQGREVFAIPGSIHSPLARGCHALIRQGAKLVETANDVLEEIGPLAGAAREIAAGDVMPPRPPPVLEPELAQLLGHFGHDSANIDQLVERSGLTAESVSSMLLQLELQGLIEAGAGGRYQRII